MNELRPLREKRQESELFVDEAYKVLYEDDWMMVVDKPAPLPVHSVGRFRERNLLSLLKKDGAGEGCAIVNRLDSETSGIVVVSKHSEAAGQLGSQFENRTVEKEYQGIMIGNLPVSAGLISTPLGYEEENSIRRRKPDRFGETAETSFQVLEQKPGFSRLRILPKTGRMHQIRAHFAFIGHPLVGDKIYIDPKIFETYVEEGWQDSMRETVLLPRLALHAIWLKLKHPHYGDSLEFHSPLPSALENFWEDLPRI